MHKQRIIILAAAGIGLLGCLLPWIAANLWIISESWNGLNHWTGWAAFGGFASAASMGFMGTDRNQPVEGKNKKFISLGGVAAVVFPMLFIIIHLSSQESSVYSYKFGLFLTILAGIAVAAIPFVVKDDGSFGMPTKEGFKADLDKMKEGTPLK